MPDPIEPPGYISAADLDRARPYIEAALEHAHGTHLFEDVIAEVHRQTAQLWIWERSALVTQLTQYPRLKVCTFWLAGGDMDELISVEPGVVAWAQREGCTRVAIIGRKGWQRAFQPLGYRPAAFTTFKEV